MGVVGAAAQHLAVAGLVGYSVYFTCMSTHMEGWGLHGRWPLWSLHGAACAPRGGYAGAAGAPLRMLRAAHPTWKVERSAARIHLPPMKPQVCNNSLSCTRASSSSLIRISMGSTCLLAMLVVMARELDSKLCNIRCDLTSAAAKPRPVEVAGSIGVSDPLRVHAAGRPIRQDEYSCLQCAWLGRVRRLAPGAMAPAPKWRRRAATPPHRLAANGCGHSLQACSPLATSGQPLHSSSRMVCTLPCLHHVMLVPAVWRPARQPPTRLPPPAAPRHWAPLGGAIAASARRPIRPAGCITA